MTDKEAIKLAYDYIVYGTGDLQQVLIALLDAMDEDLAQPEQEPDVVMHWDSHTWTTNNPPPKGSGDVNLYYAPAAPLQEPVIDKSAAIRIATALDWEPKRTWVDLTDEEIDLAIGFVGSFGSRQDARAIEAKLKEKNT